MSNPLKYEYVYLSLGPHHRRPRTGSGSGFTEVPGLPAYPPPGVTNDIGNGIYVPYPPDGVLPATNPVSSQPPTFDFAFVNVSGGSAGPQMSLDAASPPVVMALNSPITVLSVYASPGGGGNGKPGVTIDALDASTNLLVEDLFVSVVSAADPSTPNPLTTTANNEGWVPTSEGVTITADAVIVELPKNPALQFARWMTVVVDATTGLVTTTNVYDRELVIPQDATWYCLAIYENVPAKAKEKDSLWDHKHVKEIIPEKEPLREVVKSPLHEGFGKGGIGKEKDMEGSPGFGQGGSGGGLASTTSHIEETLERLGKEVRELRAFIRPEQRPAVGEQVIVEPEDEGPEVAGGE